MYAKPPKKLLIMNILDILRKYTDENHRLSQNDILEILEREYQSDENRAKSCQAQPDGFD